MILCLFRSNLWQPRGALQIVPSPVQQMPPKCQQIPTYAASYAPVPIQKRTHTHINIYYEYHTNKYYQSFWYVSSFKPTFSAPIPLGIPGPDHWHQASARSRSPACRQGFATFLPAIDLHGPRPAVAAVAGSFWLLKGEDQIYVSWRYDGD
jgi:hypothetical protein